MNTVNDIQGKILTAFEIKATTKYNWGSGAHLVPKICDTNTKSQKSFTFNLEFAKKLYV